MLQKWLPSSTSSPMCPKTNSQMETRLRASSAPSHPSSALKKRLLIVNIFEIHYNPAAVSSAILLKRHPSRTDKLLNWRPWLLIFQRWYLTESKTSPADLSFRWISLWFESRVTIHFWRQDVQFWQPFKDRQISVEIPHYQNMFFILASYFSHSKYCDSDW